MPTDASMELAEARRLNKRLDARLEQAGVEAADRSPGLRMIGSAGPEIEFSGPARLLERA